ncbi:hypothetical protein GCM10023166_17360 [Paeniglutamicibacter cryotolerans]
MLENSGLPCGWGQEPVGSELPPDGGPVPPLDEHGEPGSLHRRRGIGVSRGGAFRLAGTRAARLGAVWPGVARGPGGIVDNPSGVMAVSGMSCRAAAGHRVVGAG